MSDVAIRVERLGKQYRIGLSQASYRTLRESLTQAVRAPFARAAAALQGAKRDAGGASGTIWALRDLSLEVKQGEVVGIIGRNGAGKSTLLKILSRITEPTEGLAEIHGRVGSLLEVGTGFHPELTGRENIYLSGAILGMSKSEISSKFDEIVAFAEIDRFIDTPVKHYSSGMYVRLAFAVAAHLEPEVLLVDEVLAVGDLQFQTKCLGKMHSVSQAGRTILFVSHNMPAITRLCSRAVLLDKGQVVATGPAGEIVSQYLSSSLGASGTAEWSDLDSSPGSNGFRLLSVSVVDEQGTTVSVVDITQTIKVKIGYHVAVPGLRFRCEAILQTQGVCAFVTHELVETERAETGYYCSTVHVPANLLAEGEYTVTISVYASRGAKLRYCRVPDVVAFEVYDPITGNSARGDYSETMLGVVRPLLHWQVDYCGSEPKS